VRVTHYSAAAGTHDNVASVETSLPDQPALSSPTVFGAVLKIPAPDFIVDGDYTPIGGRTSARDAVYQSVLRSTEKIVDLVYSGASQWKPVTPDDTSVDFHGEMDGWERFVWTNVGSRPDPEEPEKNLNALCVIQSPCEYCLYEILKTAADGYVR
jgi:hypothetical protein